MQMHERILESATRLFAAKGFEATSLQEISDAVGVRKPSVLHHFPSKEALHAGVLSHLLTSWTQAVPRLLRAAAGLSQKPGADRFEALVDEAARFFLEDPDRARLLLREALDRPEALTKLLRAQAGPWIEAVAGALKSAQGDGTVRDDVDPEAYVLQMVHLIIANFAVGSVLRAAVAGRSKNKSFDELKRIARVSLLRRRR
jgi:AcrR family transcriptional regulator